MGDLLEDDFENSYSALTAVWDSMAQWCEAFLKRKDELQWIRDYGFDLVFTDDPNLCSVGAVHYLGIRRHIWIASGPLHETNSRLLDVFGVPPQLSYVPVLESGFLLGPIMSFMGRLTNAYAYAVSTLVHWRHVRKLNHIFRKHVSADFPDVAELASKAALCFVNSDEFVDVARPILHKTIYVGGIGIDKPKPLTGAAAKAMSKGSKGVILMAFGTTAPTTFMNPEKKKALFNAFAELSDYHFIAKINSEDAFSLNYTKNIANIETVEWFAQRDALGHPRMRLFISHGGYNSVLESAISGVPMVVIPMFFDHFRNGKMVEYRGFGRVLERSRLQKEHVLSVLRDVLEDAR
ncbi:CBN-UGT-49 protein [Aphelenchoides avenae]|nr:CBN-UGT-49 protein [Aphelenchus avenae]